MPPWSSLVKILLPHLFALLLVLPVFAAEPVAVSVALDDQFEKKQDLKTLRGDVVVFLYGDRHATDANRKLGEQLHVRYHPAAKGQTPAEARKAPVVPVAGVAVGQASPDVKIIPVACTGKVPELVMTFLRRELKRASPDVAVWIDPTDTMKSTFGLRDGEPNLVIVDAQGRLRFKAQGELDAKTADRVVEVIDYLRKEAAGGK
jgi:hypothetical protein